MKLAWNPKTENRSSFSGGGINLVVRGPAVLRADRPDHGTFDSLRYRLDAPDVQRHLP